MEFMHLHDSLPIKNITQMLGSEKRMDVLSSF